MPLTLATIVANIPILSTRIETYHSTIANYRSEHAPNRRYLPSDVTVFSIYNNVKEKKNIDLCYSLFYRIFKTMNSSMAFLGHKECEVCEAYHMFKF
ncbi:Cai-1 autoinducer sensor kinase/phosphatase cqss [Plakobranchus ocellatus]|uniref:Cai-1 autoinducer sensor kinase/phosphatase cqss n=1 Tax=Plakobranchus ocellatus TaxID=259542 RepID=A0AAV4CCW2_9GAST|nr:Cai-1 autoinducer sensor kinase/phosphatase cqss [Plakobranchus ocellatus]